ncbi:tRNA wybutosine-synthesizing protein 3 homolog [Mytilus californianus]|uniref:tRNA wybutosine-synthesizing protein 3 homolog n=1 Tax=Mytilus californianus TaxID=6549 RepID=UPI002247E476|nr:tRNA wybutosine-synthesizing protein 3 homolog [Mytilus californianus]
MEIFEKQKKSAVSGVDFSRKGSIDVKIIDLSLFINNQRDYFTTSSCSGRIILFDDSVGESDKVTNKQGCRWLFTSHDLVDKSQMMPVLEDITGDCVFKFEPFVLHVQCRTIDFAQLLLQCAVQSGFRNSGISLGKKGKIIVGVRSTHSMEVPLSHSGQLLVSSEYVEYLISLANKKMEENFRRIDRFYENLKSAILQKSDDSHIVKQCKEKVKMMLRDKYAGKVETVSSEKQKEADQENIKFINMNNKDALKSCGQITKQSDFLDNDMLGLSLFDDEVT